MHRAFIALLVLGSVASAIAGPAVTPVVMSGNGVLFSPSAADNYCGVFAFTGIKANTSLQITMQESPGYTVSVVFAPPETVSASGPIPAKVPCYNAADLNPQVDAHGSIKYSPLGTAPNEVERLTFNMGTCFKSDTTIFLSVASKWTGPTGTGPSEDRFNATAPRNLVFTFEQVAFNGTCRGLNAVTGSTLTATVIATTTASATSTVSATTSSKPASAAGVAVGVLAGLIPFISMAMLHF